MLGFNYDMFNRISNILLKTQSDDDLSLAYTSRTINVKGNESTLYIKLFKDELQIPYIVFKNKRVGTATELVNECKNICKELDLSKIVISGVMSEEMESFCNKLNFKRLADNGFGYYDYELVV